MLPDIQQADYLYDVPMLEISKDDFLSLLPELKGFYENFADCFLRSELRDNFFFRYMAVQLSPLERNIADCLIESELPVEELAAFISIAYKLR
jgi:hypothetical protein